MQRELGPIRAIHIAEGALNLLHETKRSHLVREMQKNTHGIKKDFFIGHLLDKTFFWNQTFHHKSTEMGPYGCVKQENHMDSGSLDTDLHQQNR